MPFVFVRVYQDSIFSAGLRLSIVPVMLGLVAPVGGALYDRLGARLLTASGMLICVIGLALLFAVMNGTPASLALVMLALAIFGVGQGLFISPNNSAIMAAAPASLTGEAGGLLNVMRSLGISIGVAAASSLLAWRLAVLTGSGHNTLAAEGRHLLAAGHDVIILLGGCVTVAGALSLTRTSPRSSRKTATQLE
jgi:MFS family permease